MRRTLAYRAVVAILAVLTAAGCQKSEKPHLVSWTFSKNEARLALEESERLAREHPQKPYLDVADLMSAAYWVCVPMPACESVQIESMANDGKRSGSGTEIVLRYLDASGQEVHVDKQEYKLMTVRIDIVDRVWLEARSPRP